MAFLDKIKGRIEKEKKELSTEEKPKGVDSASDFMQLDVDIFQTKDEIVIIAPIAGINVDDLDISVENENDVITIQGKRALPQLDIDFSGDYLRQENQWGAFYRQIILPQEINTNEIKAKVKKSILVLRLPLLRLHNKRKLKIDVQKT